jgi:arabinan endo-1,5-alpha-L-arabinosidase
MMIFSTKTTLSAFAIFAHGTLASAVASKRATYPNPIALSGNTSAVRDPTLCKDPSSSTYYVFSTGVGIPIRSSKDLVHWEYVGQVWPDGASWGDQYNNNSNIFWAPDCTILDGKWIVRPVAT